MTALEKNNFPETDAGLMSMWEFASDTTKYIFQNNMTGKCPCVASFLKHRQSKVF
jgi:hypothetical protein